jgi:hypothetical protein
MLADIFYKADSNCTLNGYYLDSEDERKSADFQTLTLTPSIKKYLQSIETKQQLLSNEREKFEQINSTKSDVQSMKDYARLKTFVQQFTNEVFALNPPTKIAYCIDEIDELETKIENLLDQAYVTGNYFIKVTLRKN